MYFFMIFSEYPCQIFNKNKIENWKKNEIWKKEAMPKCINSKRRKESHKHTLVALFDAFIFSFKLIT